MARLEDHDLLTGDSRFVADLDHDGALHAQFVRSNEAHGTILSVDTADALEAPGVVAVHTAESLRLGPVTHAAGFPSEMRRHPLASVTVRHVGEAVAVIVAESAAEAIDAAELVWADIDPLPALVGFAAGSTGTPMYPGAEDNVVHALADDGDDPVAGADHVVDVSIANQRITSAPIENDGVLVVPDGDGLEMWCTTQGVHGFKNELVEALDLDPASVRVRAPAVGGAFGGRVSLPVEFIVVARLALDLGRPVRWIQNRFENLTCMPQGRDMHTHVRLGVSSDGHFVGMDADVTSDVGATAHVGAGLLISVRRQAPGLYRVPALRWNGRAVLSNTPPVGAYRGAGQPEANHARERAIDIAARRLGVDPIELRRRNLHVADDFPLDTTGGVTYDAADPVAALDEAVRLLDLDARRVEQQRRRAEGAAVELGIGVSCYAQTSGRGSPSDAAMVTIDASGGVTIASGSPSHGQGHRSMLARLVSRRLGVDPGDVTLVDADTAAIHTGLTTGGSRASQVLASVVDGACTELVDAGRELAAAQLEAAVEDIVVVEADGAVGAGLAVAGVPSRRVTWAELAEAEEHNCLEALREDAALGEAHPYGTHASVVEVDTDTGEIVVLAHVAVDDCGEVLEPEIVAGQQHGGSVAGVAQAIWEYMGFDPDGQPTTANFTTYGLPSAPEVPPITTAVMHTLTERNSLGSRGIGENGCNGATAAVHNAVMDALSSRGVEHIDLPLTPEKVWRAINSADAD